MMANARRNVEAFQEMLPAEAWGAGSAPPELDAAAKLAGVMWPVSDLFPPEGGSERTLGRPAPPTDPEARTDFFIKQLFQDAAQLYSADEYVICTRGRI